MPQRHALVSWVRPGRRPSHGLKSVNTGLQWCWACLALNGCLGEPSEVLDGSEVIDRPSAAGVGDPSLPIGLAPAVQQFAGVTAVPLGLSLTPLSLEPGDFDGDGIVDLLVAGVNANDSVEAVTFLGVGDGTFAAPINANLVGCSAFPVVGNLDNDARSDVIIAGCDDDLAVYVGQPDGTLAPWPVWPNIDHGNVHGTVIADYEGDGDQDVLTVRNTGFLSFPGPSFVDLTLSNGGVGIWSLTPSEIGNPAWSGFEPVQLVAGHFNDDDLIDVALTDTDHDIARMFGVAPANFGFPLQIGVDLAPSLARPGDLTNNGRDELIIISNSGASLQVLVPDGSGELLPLPPIALGNFSPYDLTLGDFDADGRLDVAMIDDGQRTIRWMRGLGNGSFGGTEVLLLPDPAIRIHATDLDGDGDDDLVAATYGVDTISVLLNTAI